MATLAKASSDLLVVSYPDVTPEDLAWIETIRARHHPRHAAIAAHFTLVFPVTDLDSPTLIAEIQRETARGTPIRFVLRCALPFPDATSDATDVFLVPDEGFGALVRLHDRLYSGMLAPALRLDLPFVPHLTVGRFTDAVAARQLADRLNAGAFAIPGTLSSVDVVQRKGTGVQTLARIPLGGEKE
jgi:2'-5' RNA ligase